MRAEEFLEVLSKNSKDETQIQALKNGIPLGTDSVGNLVFSKRQEQPFSVRHTCVTGPRRTAFIKRLITTLSCLYEKSEANFLVISPRLDYGELFRLQALDITAPFIRTVADLQAALACVKELMSMQQTGRGYPKLFLVLDGLEELDGTNTNADLEEYRNFFDALTCRKNVEVITGAELMRSIFSGYPGAFVGVGNCLVTTREEGVADVTYVQDDSSLSLPTVLHYPFMPSFTETVIYLNSLLPSQNVLATEENE